MCLRDYPASGAKIADGSLVRADHIYLNPPKKFVEVRGGRFYLSEKEDRKLSFPISSFFQSLAVYKQEHPAAIVLSGTGSDGSEGIKYVKEEGGLVMAQLPETAKFDGMPKNAIQTGAVDKICEVSQMPAEINRFFKNPLYQKELKNEQEIQSEMIASILEVIEKDTGVSFS